MSRHRLYFRDSSDEDIKNLSDSSLSINEKQTKSVIPKLSKCKVNLEGSDSDFDSNPDDFFHNRKLPYTTEEDEMILKFILKGGNIFRTSSITLWKHLESKKEKPFRTFQSLKNRFLRNIKPNIFTKYKHLVEDEELAKKILLKFPELSRSHARAKKSLNIARRNTNNFLAMENQNYELVNNPVVEITEYEENIKGETIPKQVLNKNTETVLKPSCSELSTSLAIAFAQALHSTADLNSKEINLDNDRIIITFKNNYFKETTNLNTLKIYEKYLKMKYQNEIPKCRYCGQSDFEENVVEANKIQNENSNQNSKEDSDVIIIDSHSPQDAENLIIENVTLKVEKVSPQCQRSSQKQKGKLVENGSPSLLKDVSTLGEKSPSHSNNWKQNKLYSSPVSRDKPNHSTQHVSGYFLRKESLKENIIERVMNYDSNNDLENFGDSCVNKKRRKLFESSDDGEHSNHYLNHSNDKEKCGQISDLESLNIEVSQFSTSNSKNSLLANMIEMTKSYGVKLKTEILENRKK